MMHALVKTCRKRMAAGPAQEDYKDILHHGRDANVHQKYPKLGKNAYEILLLVNKKNVRMAWVVLSPKRRP